MIEKFIKNTTCRITCGETKGTGWLIDESKIITARHCVLPSINSSEPISLCFPEIEDKAIKGKIVEVSEEWDMCIVGFDVPLEIQRLPLNFDIPREGSHWETFGYPMGKLEIGHRLSGTIAQVVKPPKLKIDLDLTIASSEVLDVYKGMSGSVVVHDGSAVAVLRLKVNGTIAALTLNQLRTFFEKSGLTLPSTSSGNSASSTLADRETFPENFTKIALERSGNFLFLEGAHGYGKSTFCRYFLPEDQNLVYLGAYCLSDPESALGANYRAKPQVFLDWLATTVAALITGEAPRIQENNSVELIRQSSFYINEFSKYCEQSNRYGLLVLDGLNEVTSEQCLDELLELLPVKLPYNITILLTGPNYSNLANHLQGRVRASDTLQLPPLSRSACFHFCQQTLVPERRLPELVDRICEKAQGHPLYLRYLIEYANEREADDNLEDFPTLTGPIEDYYQRIWDKLLPDGDAVNLLALMARLRWGLPLREFVKVLQMTEQTQFVSVISRIRHLLEYPNNTAIYHSSFQTFIIEKTSQIESLANQRLAQYCLDESDLRYCALNRVFHLAKTDNHAELFSTCNQEWFDSVVELGVEPDALISDVSTLVKRASKEATPQEFFRLTLLAQRISFRYNTLFAQSAREIAEAMIVLNRPDEAFQHVMRLNTLIIDFSEALEISFLFYRHGETHKALQLLEQVERRIVEGYQQPIEASLFLQLSSFHLQTQFLARLATNGSGTEQFERIIGLAKSAMTEAFSDADEGKNEIISDCMQPLVAESPAYFLTFCDEYSSLSDLRKVIGDDQVELSPFLPSLCIALLKFESSLDSYRLSRQRESLNGFFADLDELIRIGKIDSQLAVAVTNALIRLEAPIDLVERFGKACGTIQPRPVKLMAKNGVDVDREDLHECQTIWRISAYLDSTYRGPASIISNTQWTKILEHLIGALYCCDGRARRAKRESNKIVLSKCFEDLKRQVIEPLQFSLSQRAQWTDCYAVPEEALPDVYRQLAELLSDCFPEKLLEWLELLVTSSNVQYGMYSEGYRTSTYKILEQLTREEAAPEIVPKLISLLQNWHNHVVKGIENRHELVPELLRMIPLYSHFGAHEEAARVYKLILSVSMGPTWYKEDQLGIMTEVLNKLDTKTDISPKLPMVAGYLERASGEMTFQRYIRYEKASLLGELIRRGRYRAAFEYFQRQCCGSLEELWQEAEQGPIDKLGPLKGNRFPGGALDDQEAALAIVKNSNEASWELRWALLETFHCGDSRHIDEYAKNFARLCNLAGSTSKLIERLKIVVYAETANRERDKFIASFQRALNPKLHTAFSFLFSVPESNSNQSPAPPRTDSKHDDNDESNNSNDESLSDLYSPGIIGKQSALADGDKLLEEAEQQLSIGNQTAAKSKAAEALQATQKGGWRIWGGMASKEASRAEEILRANESSAADVIRQYAPLIEAEQYAQDWIPAHHLIGKVGSLLNEQEGLQLMSTVIEHVRIIVGDSSNLIKAFDYLAEEPTVQEPDAEFFRFLVWLTDHPSLLRRDRAASMLLWLVDNNSELLSLATANAFSMNMGHGSDLLCGILDGLSAEDPLKIWNATVENLDLFKVVADLQHVSRMVILTRIASRAAKAGSQSAQIELDKLQAVFSKKQRGGSNPQFPEWTSRLAPELSTLGALFDSEMVNSWESSLAEHCLPLSIEDAWALEDAVLNTFQEGHRRHDRWEAKLRYSLNICLWHWVSGKEAITVEKTLRNYNPSLPERTVAGKSNPLSDQLLRAVETDDFSNIFGAGNLVTLNYHEMVVRKEQSGMDEIEVLCLLQPNLPQQEVIGPKPIQKFRSSEFPQPHTAKNPFETCCHLEPEVVFFDTFTPAIPHPFFRDLVKASDNDFIRENWRFGRRNELRGLGIAERSGCSLSIPRNVLNIPSNMKLVWLVWFNRELVVAMDDRNNRLI